MFCEHCGRKLSEKHIFCDNCGAPVASLPVTPTPLQKLHCPHCNSEELYPITSTDTTISTSGGGFSAGKGCLGYFLLGPLGLLCGACGSKVKTDVSNSTKTYWACRTCGKKFLDIDNLNALIESEKASLGGLRARLFFAIFIAVVCVIIFLTHLGDIPDSSLPFISIWVVVMASFPLFAAARLDTEKKRCEELEHEKAFLEQHAYGRQINTR